MNFSDEIYKKKYLKYKNKYLELKQKGGFSQWIKSKFEDEDELTPEEKKSLCTTPNYVFDDCGNETIYFPPNITKEERHALIEKRKDIMLNSQKDTYNKIREIKYTNGDIYSGLLENGIPNGQGKMTYKNGDIYEGTFNQGIPEGKKEIKSEEYTYFGEVKDNKLNGHGDIIFKNGNKYTGTFKNGNMDGQGKMTYKNGDIYDGEFTNNKKNGEGMLTVHNGNTYIGNWDNDKKYGHFDVKTGFGSFDYTEEYNQGRKEVPDLVRNTKSKSYGRI